MAPTWQRSMQLPQAGAELGVDDRVVIGIGHRVLEAILWDAAEDAATAPAAVKNVAHPFHHVAYGMHQPYLLALLQQGQCLRL